MLTVNILFFIAGMMTPFVATLAAYGYQEAKDLFRHRRNMREMRRGTKSFFNP